MPLPIIAITNQSTVLTDHDVQAVLPALQRQVTFDFKGYWNMDCTLWFTAKGEALPEGWWQIVILDDPDMAGALGYHELASNGCPLGKVFAKLDLENGLSWTVTLSHELLEMLADPYICWQASGSDGKIYALEVCDPCESDDLGYLIDGVLVSDFITPAWFERTHADRFDFKKRLSKRFELAKGGYISVLDPREGWTQIFGETLEGGKRGRASMVPPQGSRRARRTHWDRRESHQ